jgi:PiT family inorganic phosphate transporter
MPDWPLVLLVAVVLLALVFDYTNGMHDSANAIATVVSTKVLSPRAAVCMAAVLNLLGALTGGKVAETVGNGIVNAKLVKGCLELVLAALLGAILWNLLTWYFGLPSSSSHALIGGLIGAALTYRGMHAVNVASIVKKVMVPLVTSPLAGFVFGYLFMLTLAWSLLKAHPRKANLVFRRLQAVSAAGMALSHGLNDAQ